MNNIAQHFLKKHCKDKWMYSCKGFLDNNICICSVVINDESRFFMKAHDYEESLIREIDKKTFDLYKEKEELKSEIQSSI